MEDTFRKRRLLLEILRTGHEETHFHQEIELVYVLEGTLTVLQGTQQTIMQPHDIYIINTGIPHILRGSESVLYTKLSIQYALIYDVVDSWELVFRCDSTRNRDDAYGELERLLRRLLSRYLGERYNTRDFLYISLCYQILDFICAHFLIRDTGGGRPEKEEGKYELRKRQINSYIQSAYADDISLKDLAQKMYLSSGYLSRFFRRQFGMDFSSYLTRVRLHHAVEELLYTDNPITRIVYDNGFANVTVFNKAFRAEYGETPTEMRTRSGNLNRADPEPLTPEDRSYLKDILWPDVERTPVSELRNEIDIQLSAADSAPYTPIWSRVINVGSANDLLRSRMQEHIALLRRTLGISCVRFWSPFTREMLIDPSVSDHYNFTRLDAALDYLLEQDIRPWIELAAKPRRVQRAVDASLVLEVPEEIPSLDDYTRLLEAFVRHILTRYGRAEVERWTFELWFDYVFVSSEEMTSAFAERLGATVRIIHQYLSQAAVGGGALHRHVSSLDEKTPYLRRLMEKIFAAGPQPDFISLYIYPYNTVLTPDGISSTRSSDRDLLRHCIEEFHRAVPEIAARGIRVCVTEWNMSISHRNCLNDSCYRGAYFLRNYIDMVGLVDCLACFEGSDRSSEFYDTQSCLFGGIGIISKDSILKPAGFALSFLHRLYDRLVGKGEHYLLTTDGHGSYGMVCHNMRELSYSYYIQPEDALDRDHLSRYYEDMDVTHLTVQLRDVAPGTYQMKLFRVNSLYGSVFHAWKGLDFAPDLSREDVHYLQSVCQPNLTIHCLPAPDGVLHITLDMQPQEIAYLHLACKY